MDDCLELRLPHQEAQERALATETTALAPALLEHSRIVSALMSIPNAVVAMFETV